MDNDKRKQPEVNPGTNIENETHVDAAASTGQSPPSEDWVTEHCAELAERAMDALECASVHPTNDFVARVLIREIRFCGDLDESWSAARVVAEILMPEAFE